MNFRFILEINTRFNKMTWYYWILIRRNMVQFDFFTSIIIQLLGWKLVRLSTSWSGSGATCPTSLCRWRSGAQSWWRVAGHSPCSGPGPAGDSRLSRHNVYLQSVIIKCQYFTFETKLPIHLLPRETWGLREWSLLCHWRWAGPLYPRRGTCQSSEACVRMVQGWVFVSSTTGMTWYCR